MSRKEKIVVFIVMFTSILYPFAELARNIVKTFNKEVVYLTPASQAIPELIYMFTTLVIFTGFLIYVLKK